MALTGKREPEAAALAILAAGAARAIVTLGEEGALLASPGRAPLSAPAPRTAAVDATGAGDSVAAVLAAALAEAGELDALASALRLAVETGARVVGAPGALAGLPEASEARGSLAAALEASR
jgi:ribokinase